MGKLAATHPMVIAMAPVRPTRWSATRRTTEGSHESAEPTDYGRSAMVAQAQFLTSDVTVQPGEQVELTLTLVNLGNRTETFTLVPSGLLAGWTRTDPPTVTLFGGSAQHIKVTLRPPQLASTPAGPAALTLRIIPQDEPDEVVVAETTIEIGAFQDRRIQLLQPVIRSRRRAVYEFLVENQGNSQATCRLHLIDTSQRLDGDFDPPAVGVEPGANSLVRLKMKAVRRHWRRGSRIIPFAIEADQPGFPSASGRATFVQTPAFPDGMLRKLAAFLVIAGLLVVAWFALLKPLTKRTAEDAVEGATPPAVTVTTVAGDPAPPPSTAVPVSVPAVQQPDDGVLWSNRFNVTAAPGQVQPAQYTVEPGKELHVTDIFLQNIYNDTGLATLLRNDQVIVQWSLGDAQLNNDGVQLVSPLVFKAGENVVFQLMCGGVGNQAATGGQCTDSLLVTGRLIDAP